MIWAVLMFSGGNSGWNIGANATLSGSIGPIDFAIGGGAGYGTDYFTGFTGKNANVFAAFGAYGNIISTRHVKGACLDWQHLGGLRLQFGGVGFNYENDGFPFHKMKPKLAGGTDGFRSAALSLHYKDYSVGVHIFTGERDMRFHGKPGDIVHGSGAHGFLVAPAYIGYEGWRVGVNDYRIGHAVQNKFAHSKPFGKPQAWFNWKGHTNRPVKQLYSGYMGSTYPFSDWY